MRELLETIDSWRSQGKQVALATVVAVEGSTPRATGAKMAVTPEGDLAGSVSGGCVEADVFEQACEVVASGTPRLLRYGFSGDAVFEIGLACGGAIQVFIEPPAYLTTAIYDRLAKAVRDSEPVCEVTVLSGSRSIGAKMLVFSDGSQQGALGLGEVDARIGRDAREALRAGHSLLRSYYLEACDGEMEASAENAVKVFLECHVPPPTLLIVGAGHTSIALSAMAKLLGFSVVLIDARAALATTARFPQADEIVVEWPHVALATKQITSNTYVAVLTHDAKFEEPLLPLLLRSSSPYIGVIGSKRTQALRLQRLRDQGFGDQDLQRVRGPVGLDIGAVTPEEIALSVMAEIVASQHHRLGTPLRDAFVARQLSAVSSSHL